MSATRQMRRYQERMARKGKPVQSIAVTASHHAHRLVSCALIRDGETHRGFKSHSDLRRSLGDADPYTAKRGDEYGFVTESGAFVTRQEAVPFAVAAGQLDRAWLTVRRELLSSDLNWIGK